MEEYGNRQKSKGFTLIETSLVLAIAGLIMMAIFIILPSVQRNQRNAERREDISIFLNALKKYQTNNRGALPDGDAEGVSYSESSTGTGWPNFYSKYLGKDFIDPDSTDYRITSTKCDGNIGEVCVDRSGSEIDHTLYVAIGANCNDNKAVKVENPRRVAVVYKLEGPDAYCADS